jgi:hypothetical protein
MCHVLVGVSRIEATPQSPATTKAPALTVEEIISPVSGPGVTTIMLTSLVDGLGYNLRIVPVSASGVEGDPLPDMLSPPLLSTSSRDDTLLTVVTVEATTRFPSNENVTSPVAIGNTKDPIKLLPVIGAHI